MEKKDNQTTFALLMIEPVSFGFNEQTAVNNYFQQNDKTANTDIQALALAEFNAMVEKLRVKGLKITTVKDFPEPHSPDSIFPNNWISFHQDGRVALYSMYAENRRTERRADILHLLTDRGFRIFDILDYTPFEKENRFLEGTGSMVLDHANKIAYAALSERTNKDLFLLFCNDFGFHPICFSAMQTIEEKRFPIYHTNVMMCIGEQYAVICADAIDNVDERKAVLTSLTNSGKEIITISEKQMGLFAGNMLQVQNEDGTRYLVMSQSAFDSLDDEQIKKLKTTNEIINIAIPTIEKYGGGSVRCMMAELFNK